MSSWRPSGTGSHELFAYLGNAPTLPRAAAPPPPSRNGHEYLRRILRSPESVRESQHRRQLRIAVRLRPARPLPRLTCGRTMKWTAAPSRRCPTQRRQIMYARSTTIQGQPSSVDAGIAHTRDSVMPALEGIDGCVGLSLLVDRTSGRCIVTTSWESEEAMRASEESIRPVRDRAAELLGGSRQVEEWEIAAMHREHRASEGACVRATWVKVGPDQIDRGIDFYRR